MPPHRPTSTHELFDGAVPFEQRLARLLEAIEARRGAPTPDDVEGVLGELLRDEAIAIPLHLFFPDEPQMDLTLLHPTRRPDAEPSYDEVELEAFVRRHSELSEAVVERLTEAEHKYEAILGLIDWSEVFETEAAFRSACERYEVIVTENEDGTAIHEQDVLWYVAARDHGLSPDDVAKYNQLKLAFLYARGIAADDVSTTELPSEG